MHEEWKREEGECRIVNRERREEMESGKSWKRKNGQYNMKTKEWRMKNGMEHINMRLSANL